MSNLSTTGHVGRPTIRILLVDNLPESLESLKSQLHREQDFEVIEVVSLDEVVQKAKELRPDIVMIPSTVTEGLDAAALIFKALPATGVIMISESSDHDHTTQTIFKLGPRGRLLIKPFEEELLSAIRKVYKDHEPIVIRDYWPSKRH